jgi:hypothetical protein
VDDKDGMRARVRMDYFLPKNTNRERYKISSIRFAGPAVCFVCLGGFDGNDKQFIPKKSTITRIVHFER